LFRFSALGGGRLRTGGGHRCIVAVWMMIVLRVIMAWHRHLSLPPGLLRRDGAGSDRAPNLDPCHGGKVNAFPFT
jgi:hypothetical protein